MEEKKKKKALSPPSSSSTMAIIHEKQHLQLCLLHALNNLFQGETTFSRSELNSIANNLQGVMRNNGLSSSDPFSRRFFNPHYNILTGNYDANVMMMALQSRKAEAIWYDRRKGTEAMDLEETPEKKFKDFSVKNLENPGENLENLENLEENLDKVLEKIVAKNSEKNIEISDNNATKIDQKNIENPVKHPMLNPLENPEKILLGIILNQPTTRFSGLWKGRHWSALRKINGLWYDLDSYLPSPVPINDNNINHFLNQSFLCGSEAFLVFRDV